MKNNKKGFTLVELLAVIVIMAILVTIAVPSTMRISNKLKVDMYCKKIDAIETQAQLYGEDRRESFTGNFNQNGTNYKSKTITVKELVDTGYLKKDQKDSPYVVDPRNKKTTDLYNMSFTIYIKYNRAYVSFNNTVKNTCGK